VLGFDVSARTLAEYVRVRPNRGPSPAGESAMHRASDLGLRFYLHPKGSGRFMSSSRFSSRTEKSSTSK
jgi:hypothetical protein